MAAGTPKESSSWFMEVCTENRDHFHPLTDCSGAYVMFNAITHRPIAIPLSRGANARVFCKPSSTFRVSVDPISCPSAVNYRLAPETIFPGQLHDVVSSYFHLVDDLHFSPSNIIVAGDSAGGSLCLALMMYLRDHDYPLPGAAILMSPWVGKSEFVSHPNATYHGRSKVGQT